MKRLSPLLFVGILLFSCSKQDNTTPENSTPNVTSDTKQETTPATNQTTFTKLDFDTNSISKEFTYKGKLIDGAKWRDANGENTLLFSHTRTDDKEEEDLFRDDYFGYLYTSQNGQTKLLWKIQDFSNNFSEGGQGLISNIDVVDINNDNIAENIFMYELTGSTDVSPHTFKAIMHSGETKFVVSGTNKVYFSPGEKKGMGGERKFTSNFDSIPQFKTYATTFWDKHIGKFNMEPIPAE